MIAMHSLLNTEKYFNDVAATGASVASADYRTVVVMNKIHLDGKNEFLYFDFEIADAADVVTAGNITVTNLEIVVGFEYYNKRSDFARDFGIETNKVDAFSVVTGGLRTIDGVTLGKVWLASFNDGFNNSTVNLNKLKVTDNGVTIVEAQYFEYLGKHLEVTNGLMEFVDFENQLWYVPETPLTVDHTTKLEVDVSSTRDFDFIHLFLR